MNHNITTIITYCSNDHAWFEECLKTIMPISTNLIVTLGDKLWNGGEEVPRNLGIYQNTEYVDYKVDTANPPKYYVNESKRQALLYMIENNINPEYVLMLDCDEIIDTKLFKEYLDEGFYKNYDYIRTACHWYFRERKYRAIQDTEVAGGLYSFENFYNVFHKNLYPDYWGMPNFSPKQIIGAKHKSGAKMVHHYSWVRDKESMLIKGNNIGHSNERDWTSLIEQEFKGEFSGRDFVHDYRYEVIE